MSYNPEKIVIFDWGGIVESHKDGENNYFKIIIEIIKIINPNINENEIISLWKKCNLDEKGKNILVCKDFIDIENWFNRVKNAFKLNCDLETFNQIYQKEFEYVDYYKNVIQLEYETKKRCKIGILSNLIFLDKERLSKQLELNKYDYVWLSFELGELKPDNRIYEIVEDDCKLKPQNILFIDDSERNIITAKNRGWNVYNSFGYEINKIKEAIENFLR